MIRIRGLVPAMLMAAIAAVVLSGAAFAAPNGKAVGHSKRAAKASAAREGGGKPAKADGRSTLTEDNDQDGVANTPDPQGDADNRHPSGKDKHAEAGGSGNQGNAASEPDGNGKGPERDEGGLDRPGGSGGLDVLDQDGNNGCGNDDDFEDDNEGLCLGRGRAHEARPVAETSGGVVTDAGAPTEETVAVGVAGEADAGAAEVLGSTVEADTEAPEVRAATSAPARAAPAGAGGVLAFTGFEALALLGGTLVLAMAGGALLLAGRRRGRSL